MTYYIMDISKVNADTTNMRKSLDGEKVVYHENLTGEELTGYTHEEILTIMRTFEWSEPPEEPFEEPPETLPPPTLEERLEALEAAMLEMLLGGVI